MLAVPGVGICAKPLSATVEIYARQFARRGSNSPRLTAFAVCSSRSSTLGTDVSGWSGVSGGNVTARWLLAIPPRFRARRRSRAKLGSWNQQ